MTAQITAAYTLSHQRQLQDLLSFLHFRCQVERMGHPVCSSLALELLALEEAQQRRQEDRLRHQEVGEELQVELVVPMIPLSPVAARIPTKALLMTSLAVEHRSRVAGRWEGAVSRYPLGVAWPVRSRELGLP